MPVRMGADFTFIHTADVHLDSPLSGLAAKDAAFSALVRGATRRAFTNVIDLAIAEEAAFVVIAGDLYDGAWKDQGTGQFALAQLARLTRAGIRAFVAYGNHDAGSRITRHLTMPEGVYSFSNRRCETVDLADLGVAVHGRSYKDVETTDNIAAEYCRPVPGRFNLAVLHTALDGHPGHAPYAPCSLDQLAAAGHDYWALGHVHEPAVRCEYPYIVYPGNTQGRHVRETGTKGAMVVRVEEGGVARVEHRACDEVRWAQASVDAAQAQDMPELLAGVSQALREAIRGAGDRPIAARLMVRAAGPLRQRLLADAEWFGAEARGQASAVSDLLWIEKVRIEAGDDTGSRGLPPEILELLAQAAQDSDCARAIEAAVAPILGKLPADVGDVELTPLLAAARARNSAALVTVARRALEARLAESDD